MPLVTKLLLARGVEGEELGGEDVEVGVTNGAHLDLLDDLEIGRHHGNATEESLEVLGELLPSSVTGVHGDKERAHGLQENILGISRELEILNVLLLSILDREHLLGDHGEHRESDTVELIEATPKSSLTKTLEDLGTISVLHLIGTVRNDDENAQCVSKILCGLSLSGSGRTGRSSSEEHSKGLSKGDVALVGKGGDDQPLLGAKVLVLVVEVHVGDGNDGSSVTGHIIGGVGPPVEASLLEPIKVIGVSDLLLLHQDGKLVGDVTLVHVHGHQGLNFLTVDLGAKILKTPGAHFL
mmetsp:Transcript_23248/g.48266  ORF Transcript_23248/g.48266 Transcript_23248/m.48266 type:complete len:297 (-) Transcript_23248:5318-6208(-)